MKNEVVKEVIKEGVTVDGKFFDKSTVLGAIGYLNGQNKVLKLVVFGLGVGTIVLVDKLKKAKKQSVVVINVPKKETEE